MCFCGIVLFQLSYRLILLGGDVEVEELQGLVQMVFAGALKPEEHLLVD
jgi:hypothetical protein